ncbi:AGAP012000-PA-like protein [Anopheles sinensis]|uniref:AGAP012000-PA-like protein n=1 Tax=Anopheles sinensis TaxID=74873 RepID=A0A084WJZ5_ANOSI|nr:AGAP012000-PA-like protein [Anopheles sinensis]
MVGVKESIIHALTDFRKDILASLQFSLEYQSGQLEEIKSYVEDKLEDYEKRMRNESESRFSELREELNRQLVPRSCDWVKSNTTGTFYISFYGNIAQQFLVLCNFENNFNLGGGWTVFQRRFDGSVDFYQNWTMYKNGFGDVSGEHWLGLEKLHIMTRSGRHELLVLLEDFGGNKRYALYDDFKVGSEVEKYKLTVGKHSGTAGDKLTQHNGMKFSARDQDNDLSDRKAGCANYFKGAWWFKRCYHSHLNGQYYQKGNHLDKSGVEWINFPKANYSLKSTTMMFRSRT